MSFVFVFGQSTKMALEDQDNIFELQVTEIKATNIFSCLVETTVACSLKSRPSCKEITWSECRYRDYSGMLQKNIKYKEKDKFKYKYKYKYKFKGRVDSSGGDTSGGNQRLTIRQFLQ